MGEELETADTLQDYQETKIKTHSGSAPAVVEGFLLYWGCGACMEPPEDTCFMCAIFSRLSSLSLLP